MLIEIPDDRVNDVLALFNNHADFLEGEIAAMDHAYGEFVDKVGMCALRDSANWWRSLANGCK